MTFREFFLMLEGRRNIQETIERSQWERTRWLAWITLQPHVKKNSLPSVFSLGHFQWEEGANAGKTRTDSNIIHMLQALGEEADSMLKAIGNVKNS